VGKGAVRWPTVKQLFQWPCWFGNMRSPRVETSGQIKILRIDVILALQVRAQIVSGVGCLFVKLPRIEGIPTARLTSTSHKTAIQCNSFDGLRPLHSEDRLARGRSERTGRGKSTRARVGRLPSGKAMAKGRTNWDVEGQVK
jgi:hypothetical protein